MSKMYEVCENTQNCSDARSANPTQHPLGTSICPICAADLVVKDPGGGLTQLLSNVPGIGRLFQGSSSPAQPRATSIVATSGQVVGNLNITVFAVLPAPLETAILVSYDFTDLGQVHPVTPEHPLCGDITTGMLVIGAAHPYGDSKPGFDCAPFAAFPPHVSEMGDKIGVAMSRFMAGIRWDADHFTLIAGTGSNRPKRLQEPDYIADRSMAPGDEVVLENGALYLMGDVVLRFEHNA